MIILDSNIVIYSALPENEPLREFITVESPVVSVITRVEVLGFHDLITAHKEYFESFFASACELPISDEIIDKAIELKQHRNISLGDSLIAATALENSLVLATANIKDFQWIDALELIDPLENK